MNEYDVIIAGSGPSGSSCAQEIAKNGFKVLLIDRKKRGQEKPCGGGISKHTLKELGLEDFGLKVKGINVISDKKTFAKIPWNVVMRHEFDELLCGKAKESGAEIQFETIFMNSVRENDKIIVETDKGKFSCKILVGADGVMSRIREKMFKEKIDLDMLAVAAEYWFKGTHNIDTLDFYVENEIPFGYSWVFPKTEAAVVIGCCGLKTKSVKEELDKVVEKRSEIVKGMEKGGIQVAMIPFRNLKSFVDSRVVLVGDAAGLGTPIVFAGIPIALKSGKLAGEKISNALKKNNFDLLKEYNIDALRNQSSSFTACHDFWNYLVENRKAPGVGYFVRRYFPNMKRIITAIAYSKLLDKLSEKMPRERLSEFK